MQICNANGICNANLHYKICNAKPVMQKLQLQILTEFALQILTDFALQILTDFALQICITDNIRFVLQICVTDLDYKISPFFVLQICIADLYYRFCSVSALQICITNLRYRFALQTSEAKNLEINKNLQCKSVMQIIWKICNANL
jgi:hypothetical protein